MIFIKKDVILDQHPLLALEQHPYQPIITSLTLKSEASDWFIGDFFQQQQQQRMLTQKHYSHIHGLVPLLQKIHES